MPKSHAALIAERIQYQARSARISPIRLLTEELIDTQRAYMLALQIILDEGDS